MDINRVIAHNVRSFRELRGISQERLAQLAEVDRTFVSKVERGDRNITADTIARLARALDVQPHVLLVEDYLDTMVGKMEVDLVSLAEMTNDNPSLRSFISGYQTEYMVRREISKQLGISDFRKYDDHDRTHHGDIWFTWHGQQYSVEVKSLQTRTVHYDKTTETWVGQYQCDGSDATDIDLPNGHHVHTVALPYGLFDIVAVGLFPFGDRWSFAFIRSNDLEPRRPGGRGSIPGEDCHYFIKTNQRVSLPLVSPYTSHILELL